MPEITVQFDTANLRERLGLTEEQLPDNPSQEQVAAAMRLMTPRTGSAAEFDASNVPDDMVLLERDQWDGIQRRLNVVANHEMTSLLDEAIRRGKIPPSRRAHYATLYQSDPADTTRRIAAMADNVIPVDARGHVGSSDDLAGEGEAYPEHWLPEVAAAQNGDRRLIVQGND